MSHAGPGLEGRWRQKEAVDHSEQHRKRAEQQWADVAAGNDECEDNHDHSAQYVGCNDGRLGPEPIDENTADQQQSGLRDRAGNEDQADVGWGGRLHSSPGESDQVDVTADQRRCQADEPPQHVRQESEDLVREPPGHDP